MYQSTRRGLVLAKVAVFMTSSLLSVGLLLQMSCFCLSVSLMNIFMANSIRVNLIRKETLRPCFSRGLHSLGSYLHRFAWEKDIKVRVFVGLKR